MSFVCGRRAGLSRQAWYAAARRRENKCFHQDLILGEVRRIRRQIPGIGTAKLHELMKEFVRGHQIKLGRDKLHKLLKDNSLLVKRKDKRIRTTNSEHCFYRYPNHVKNLIPKRANMLWVADMTARRPLTSQWVQTSFTCRWSWMLIRAKLSAGIWTKPCRHKDRYRHWKWHCYLGKTLRNHSFTIAPATRSDRGVQYCSWKYVDRLRNENVTISMAESGDPNENALAERVFRTLKEDFRLTGFFSFSSAQTSIAKAIYAYNSFRPHASVGYLTPNQAHHRSGPLSLKWYPYKKVRFGNVQYSTHSQRTG